MYLEIELINLINSFSKFIKSLGLDREDWARIILPGLFTLGGAFLGALLSGVIAISSVQKQLQYDKRKKEYDDIQEELKVMYSYYSYLKTTVTILEDLERDYNVTSIYSIPGALFTIGLSQKIKKLSEDVNYIVKELEKSNLNNTSYDYYKIYLNSLESLKLITNLLDRDTIVEGSEKNKRYFNASVSQIKDAKDKMEIDTQGLEVRKDNLKEKL